MKKHIAIITGGDSSEEVISLRSAEQIRLHLSSAAYATYIVYIKGDDWHVRFDDPEDAGAAETDMAETAGPEEGRPGAKAETRRAGHHAPATDDTKTLKLAVDRNHFSFHQGGEEIRFDFAFIAMHGPPGENGKLQAYFDLLGIPYSSAGMLSLALSFNKHVCKQLLRSHGILSAASLLLEKDDLIDPAGIVTQIGLPCFVKPNEGGSSFGITRVDRQEGLEPAIRKARKEDEQVLVESFIGGTELTCGVLKLRSRAFLFPVTEVVSKNEFFDYEAKYTKGMADEITPARIPDALAKSCQETASRIYDLLECRGLVRIDFIEEKGRLYFLELNGIPGTSRESILPQQIRAAGHTEGEIYRLIVEDAFQS